MKKFISNMSRVNKILFVYENIIWKAKLKNNSQIVSYIKSQNANSEQISNPLINQETEREQSSALIPPNPPVKK